MKTYGSIRWVLSQLLAMLAARRRFVSLSLPFAKTHRLLDMENKSILRIYGRGNEDVVSIIQVFFAEFYELSKIGPRQADVMGEYAAIVQSGKHPLIVDCGANIGLTCLYLAMLFPKAKIVGIEPDQLNCDLARKNTQDYNVEILKAAVGCEGGAARIIDGSVDSNSFRVQRNVTSDPGSVPIVSIQGVLDKYVDQMHVPFMIKIDIEGFEDDLFSKNVDWIRFFSLMVVELHDWMLPGEANSRNFLREISKLDRDFLFHNENIFSVRNGA